MAVEYLKLYQGKPTDTATALITGETGAVIVIDLIHAIENAGGTPTLSEYFVSSGTTYDTSSLIYAQAFMANEVKTPRATQIVLETANAKYAAKSSTTTQVTLTIFGRRIT